MTVLFRLVSPALGKTQVCQVYALTLFGKKVKYFWCWGTWQTMNHESNINGTDGDTSRGAVSTPLTLTFYDVAILGFFRCPRSHYFTSGQK